MRIASLSPAATEILFALGCGDQIVCTDQFSDFPQAAKRIAHVRDHQAIQPGDLRRFAPELVLTGTVIQQTLCETLCADHFAVIHQDPRSLLAIEESIRQMGTICDRERGAEALILSMRQGFNTVKKMSSHFSRRPKVYVEEWHLPPMASGNWVPDVIRLAGGEPFPVPAGALSRKVTLREVRAFDPDVIVISWCGAGLLADKKILLEREGWDTLRAVREGSVRVIDDSLLNRPGPRLVEGAQHVYGWLFERMH